MLLKGDTSTSKHYPCLKPFGEIRCTSDYWSCKLRISPSAWPSLDSATMLTQPEGSKFITICMEQFACRTLIDAASWLSDEKNIAAKSHCRLILNCIEEFQLCLCNCIVSQIFAASYLTSQSLQYLPQSRPFNQVSVWCRRHEDCHFSMQEVVTQLATSPRHTPELRSF